MKIALFGGSFDPIHNDHLYIIDYCYAQLHFDEVWVIPTYINPEKVSFVMTKDHTIQLLRFVQQKRPFLKLNLSEINKQKVCYTIDTVSTLTTQYPEHDFTFVGGDDLLATIEKWEGFETLLKLCRFVIFQRSQQNIDYFVTKYHFKFILFAHSSFAATNIRHGESWDKLHAFIRNYLHKHHIYYDSIIKAQITDPQRRQHSYHVAQTCAQLAKANHFSVKRAYTAGLFHDITKNWPLTEQIAWCKKYAKLWYNNNHQKTYHSFTGAFYLQFALKLQDTDIIQAVKYHTTGNPSDHLLSKIVYVADKISADRSYPKVNYFRQLATTNLTKAYQALIVQKYEDLISHKITIHPASLTTKAYLFWKE